MRTQQKATTIGDPAAGSPSADYAREALRTAAQRILVAGRAGKGCRLTAEETHLLTIYNLPCTGDSPDVMDGER